MGIQIDHDITPFDIAFALAGLDDVGLTAFVDEFAEDMDNQSDMLLDDFIAALVEKRDALRIEGGEA